MPTIFKLMDQEIQRVFITKGDATAAKGWLSFQAMRAPVCNSFQGQGTAYTLIGKGRQIWQLRMAVNTNESFALGGAAKQAVIGDKVIDEAG